MRLLRDSCQGTVHPGKQTAGGHQVIEGAARLDRPCQPGTGLADQVIDQIDGNNLQIRAHRHPLAFCELGRLHEDRHQGHCLPPLVTQGRRVRVGVTFQRDVDASTTAIEPSFALPAHHHAQVAAKRLIRQDITKSYAPSKSRRILLQCHLES
jgi:hypothetical protein